MPERSEIAIMADRLRSRLVNVVCQKIIIMSKYKAYTEGLYSSCPLQYQQGEDYKWIDINMKITAVGSRGKKIIFDLMDNQMRFVSACGMTGRWSWQQSKYTALILQCDGLYSYYEEVRIGGNFSVCSYPSPEYDHIFKDVGPDLMTKEVTFQLYHDIIRRPRLKNMKIGEFMMEQKYLSGVGNYLRAEIMYLSAISPHRLLSQLNDDEVYTLYYWSKTIIFATYEANGLTIQDYLDPDGAKGVYECRCYGLNEDTEGNAIIKEKDRSGRTINWCPAKQK